MPKNKKTRKQKILSDHRRHQNPVAVNSYSFEKPTISIQTPQEPPAIPSRPPNSSAIATSDYHYLFADLLKTMILTGSIIVGELILRYFAKGV